MTIPFSLLFSKISCQSLPSHLCCKDTELKSVCGGILSLLSITSHPGGCHVGEDSSTRKQPLTHHSCFTADVHQPRLCAVGCERKESFFLPNHGMV